MKSVEMFNQQLTGMGEVFNKAITPALAQIYWTSLKEFTDEQVKTLKSCSALSEESRRQRNCTTSLDHWEDGGT